MTSEGQVLHNRFRVLSQLGAGGMGSIWLAEDQLLERRVALKELVPHLRGISLAESRARVLVEARAMARVKHPAIVRIHDIFFVGDDPWIVMEYVSGRSLAEMIRDGPLDERTIAAIGLSVMLGLRAVHAAKIVHRDVKPENILADANGSVFLVDFGIAKIAGDISLTGQSKVVGTTEFMAPERLLGHPAEPASDLWSLGVTLYRALERHSPFAGRDGEQSPEAAITAILNDKPVRPARGGLLADLVDRLLCKDPRQRPYTAEIIGLLEAIVRGTASTASSNGRLPGRPSGSAGVRPDGCADAARSAEQPADPHTRPFRLDSRRVDDRELARRELADAIRGVSTRGADSGAERLLVKTDVEAAKILAGCSLEVAAELLQGIAAKRPRRAGAIIRILSVSRSGKILDYLPADVAASIVAAMSADDAVRILTRSDARTAADVVMELPSQVSGPLIEAMPGARAVAVLSHTRPACVAAVLGALADDLSARLLTGLRPDFRAVVQRHM